MKRLILTIMVASLAACAVGPDYEKPEVQTPEAWRFTDAEASDLVNTRWWTQFEDPVLDQLIDEALVANLDVRTAAARVEQFAARLDITRSEFYPQIGYGAAGDRQELSRNSVEAIGIDRTRTTYQATINVGWELDVWGRIRRASESARAQLLAAEETRRTVILSLVSSVATSYVGLRSLDRQLEIAIQTRDTREETLELFELQYGGGVIGQLQLSQIRSEYELAVSAIPFIERDIAVMENLINVLLGQNPGPIPRGKNIDELTFAQVPLGVPSDLLLRRPDIRRAEQDQIAIGLGDGMKSCGNLDRGPVEQLPWFPSIVDNPKRDRGPVQPDDVCAETLHHWPLHLSKHLVDVVDACGRRDTESFLELVIGGRGDSGLPCSPQVDRSPIGLSMMDRIDHTLSRIHAPNSRDNAAMNSGEVPQQPPMNRTPTSANWRALAAYCWVVIS